jgi:hypothetical protein
MPTARHQQRFYRHRLSAAGLETFQVVVKETDLWIRADTDLAREAREQILRQRGYIESFIEQHPGFAVAMRPWPIVAAAPEIVRTMVAAAQKAGVGPMAAVAGAVAQSVGRDLLKFSTQVIVENGGDIYLNTRQPLLMGIYAGTSPLNMKLGLRIAAADQPLGVCTSSGTIGHSRSLGRADAVCVISEDCALADAAATAVGNRVRTQDDVESAVEFAKQIPEVQGLVVIAGERVGFWGEIELVPLQRKKG